MEIFLNEREDSKEGNTEGSGRKLLEFENLLDEEYSEEDENEDGQSVDGLKVGGDPHNESSRK